jgi:UDP-N-acetylmuramoyl-tripeptide--D-alanyl-D-alanine ligase
MSAVLVDDAIEALALLGKAVAGKLGAKIVGITGSVGKTTTKEMAVAMLRTKYRVGYSPGNLNTEIGLPIALLNLAGDEEVIILEMATRGFGQIAYLCDIAPPDIAVITAIGHSHIECFGDLDGVRRAKVEIVENMSEGGTAVIHGDDPGLKTMVTGSGKRFMAFGETEGCDFVLRDIAVGSSGVRFTLFYEGESHLASIAQGSRGDAFNCAAAAAVARIMGVPMEVALGSVQSYRPVDLRLQRRKGPNSSLFLVDCYNANPESMRNAFEVAASARRTSGRLIAVLGDMLELGDTSAEEHVSLAAELIDKGFDLLLACGKEIAATAGEFTHRGGEVVYFTKHQDIADWLKDNAGEKDVILLKGSRGMALEKVLEFLDEKG